MIGQIPTPAVIQARVQTELGELLRAREELQTMLRRAKTADQLAQIQALLQEQQALEAELPERLAEARALTQGEINLGFVARVTAFAARMEDHLRQVRAAKRAVGGLGGGVEINWPKLLLVVGALAVGAIVLRAATQAQPTRRRRYD